MAEHRVNRHKSTAMLPIVRQCMTAGFAISNSLDQRLTICVGIEKQTGSAGDIITYLRRLAVVQAVAMIRTWPQRNNVLTLSFSEALHATASMERADNAMEGYGQTGHHSMERPAGRRFVLSTASSPKP